MFADRVVENSTTPKHNALLRPYIQPNEYHTKILSSNLCSIFQWITHQDNHSQALWSKGSPNGIVLLSISLLWTSKCEVSQAPFHSKGTIAQIIIRHGRRANETPVEHIRQLKEIDAPIGSLAVIDKKRGKIWYTARKRVQKSQRQPICPCGANRTLKANKRHNPCWRIGASRLVVFKTLGSRKANGFVGRHSAPTNDAQSTGFQIIPKISTW